MQPRKLKRRRPPSFIDNNGNKRHHEHHRSVKNKEAQHTLEVKQKHQKMPSTNSLLDMMVNRHETERQEQKHERVLAVANQIRTHLRLTRSYAHLCSAETCRPRNLSNLGLISRFESHHYNDYLHSNTALRKQEAGHRVEDDVYVCKMGVIHVCQGERAIEHCFKDTVPCRLEHARNGCYVCLLTGRDYGSIIDNTITGTPRNHVIGKVRNSRDERQHTEQKESNQIVATLNIAEKSGGSSWSINVPSEKQYITRRDNEKETRTSNSKSLSYSSSPPPSPSPSPSPSLSPSPSPSSHPFLHSSHDKNKTNVTAVNRTNDNDKNNNNNNSSSNKKSYRRFVRRKRHEKGGKKRSGISVSSNGGVGVVGHQNGRPVRKAQHVLHSNSLLHANNPPWEREEIYWREEWKRFSQRRRCAQQLLHLLIGNNRTRQRLAFNRNHAAFETTAKHILNYRHQRREANKAANVLHEFTLFLIHAGDSLAMNHIVSRRLSSDLMADKQLQPQQQQRQQTQKSQSILSTKCNKNTLEIEGLEESNSNHKDENHVKNQQVGMVGALRLQLSTLGEREQDKPENASTMAAATAVGERQTKDSYQMINGRIIEDKNLTNKSSTEKNVNENLSHNQYAMTQYITNIIMAHWRMVVQTFQRGMQATVRNFKQIALVIMYLMQKGGYTWHGQQIVPPSKYLRRYLPNATDLAFYDIDPRCIGRGMALYKNALFAWKDHVPYEQLKSPFINALESDHDKQVRAFL